MSSAGASTSTGWWPTSSMSDPSAAGRVITPHEVLARLHALPRQGRVRVAVDAEGGDHAPDEVVKGALAVAEERLHVILVGREQRLRQLAAGHPHVSIVNAPDVIGTTGEPARAVRALPNSSLVVAARLVADGQADAVVSAGDTGAVVAAALFHIRRMKGVLRPALCVLLPAVPLPVVFLDAGANAQVRAEHLRQFAIMGQVFAAEVLGVAQAQVGLLNIGEEPGKGTPAAVEAHQLLASDPDIHFYGNVEGRDLMNRVVDVIVTDGFTGNVALKSTEGAARAILSAMRETLTSGSMTTRIGGLLVRKALQRMRSTLDPEAYGGFYLLGMNDPVVIAHGNSRARGIGNAVLMAARGATSGLLPAIAARLGESAVRRTSQDGTGGETEGGEGAAGRAPGETAGQAPDEAADQAGDDAPRLDRRDS
jgi:glycerol-3-phosphate acyltransferase PlsX